MNLLTNFDTTLLSMAEIEGQGWLKEQEHDMALPQQEQREYGVSGAVNKLRNKQEGGYAIIYGSGGWHRYFLHPNGDVKFHRGFMSESSYTDEKKKPLSKIEMEKRIQELGFEVFGG